MGKLGQPRPPLVPDSGRTWGPVRRIQSPATGRPTTIATASGLLVLVYRAIPWLHARVAYSMGQLHLVVGMESATGRSTLHTGYLTETT